MDTEFAAAIAMKGRIGDLDADARAKVLAQWQSSRSNFHHEAVKAAHFQLAADLAGRPQINLRAGDALNLAIASSGGFTLAKPDRNFKEAALQMSIRTIDLLAA